MNRFFSYTSTRRYELPEPAGKKGRIRVSNTEYKSVNFTVIVEQ
jgi:hypothetical protein